MAKWFCRVFLIAGMAGWAEDSYRDEFDRLTEWEPRPDWLAASCANPVRETRDGVARFAVAEPGRGMKWLCAIEPVDTDLASWLVIRYRVENYAAARVDYLLWLKDGRPGDGLRLIAGDAIRADGQWHTQAFDLTEAGAVSPVESLALQCFATEAGNAVLEVDFIALTDTPPPGAEGYRLPTTPVQTVRLDLGGVGAWSVQPGWLANYTEHSGVEATAAGLRFAVAEAGRGAKWARNLDQPVAGLTWAAVRYRALGVGGGNDYALYVAAEPGGKARQEQYLVQLGELATDGAWHVLGARLTADSVKTLAVQVQAKAPDAWIEIAEIRLSNRKPSVRLSDVFDYAKGWPAEASGMQPVPLPRGNTTGADLSRRLGHEDWLAGERITAGGIPFVIRDGTDAAMVTPTTEPGDVEVPVLGQASELYLLLAGLFTASEEASFGGGSLNTVRQVERFVARLEYDDGVAEEQFPYHLAARAHLVGRGLHVYGLAADPDRALRRLVLRDGMRRGAFALVALTRGSAPGPATAATRLRAAPALPPARPVGSAPTGVSREGQSVRVDGGSVVLGLDCSAGLRVTALANRAWDGAPLRFSPGPLFRVEAEGARLSSADFVVTGIDAADEVGGRGVRIVAEAPSVSPPLRVSVRVGLAEDGEIAFGAVADFGGRDPGTTRFFFPEFSGIGFSDALDDNWYWLPRQGDVISNVPMSLRAAYAGGGNPLQVMGAFSRELGTGLYLMTQDLEAVARFYHIQKLDGAVRLGIEYSPCRGGEFPRTVLGCHQGDWHTPFERYRAWTTSWYKPAAPRKAWFREVFNFRQQFLTFTLPTSSGMFDPKSKTLSLKRVVEEDAAAFGGIDYLHLFDWGWDPVHGRCGDYQPWEYLGGSDRFRQAVHEVRDMGVPVGLYIEGYLVDPQSDLGKAHGKDWQLLGPKGEPYTYFAPSFNLCAWVEAWQEYLAATYRRARAETGAVGFYIDEYGFSGPGHLCYNPGHGHPIPVSLVAGERRMTQRVREAVGPDAVVYTEESPTDVNSQYQDGSFTYNISCARDEWSPSHVNLYRFAFPSFKTIEIITCDHPLGSNVEAVKRILFNGEAIWLEGIRDRWFAPETRAAITRMHTVLRANRECFAGDWPTPLVPTLVEGVYANAFAQRQDGRGKTCWTVYNTNYRTVRTDLLQVPHLAGATYREELSGKALTPRRQGETAVLALELGPRDVAVICRAVSEAGR